MRHPTLRVVAQVPATLAVLAASLAVRHPFSTSEAAVIGLLVVIAFIVALAQQTLP